MKKIVHFTTVHPRYDGRIFYKECLSLVNLGFDVSLVVADGKCNEMVNGVSIVDIGKSKFGRIGRLLFKSIQMFIETKRLKADLYHFHDPELIVVGLFLKLFGYKVVYDIHENLSLQILHKYWIPKFLRLPTSKIFKVIESTLCKKFDYLLVPQPSMKDLYSKYNNTELIANFVKVSPEQLREPPLRTNESCVLIHAGALSHSRGLLNMLQAYNELNDDFKLVLAGNFASTEDKSIAESHEVWKKVDFKGVIDINAVNTLYLTSSVGLILYNNVGQYYLSYAIKLFEFMAKGLPVIMPNFGEWPEFNDKYKCGICVDVQNPIEIADAIRKLHNSPEVSQQLGNNGRQAIKDKFNWALESQKLNKVYKEILNVK